MKTKKPNNIDEYISGFSEDVQTRLWEVLKIIKEIAPEAEELISYSIPALKLHAKVLIYFAAFKKHIGLYPAPIEHELFKKELAPYKSGKASARFPFEKKLPVGLIRKIVMFRLKEIQEKQKKEKQKK